MVAEGQFQRECRPLTIDDLVAQAQWLCVGIIRSSSDVIRLKFALGGLVRLVLEWSGRQDAAVEGLARTLTHQCGKLILPQRLYEAARLYEAFGGEIERVWEFERRLPAHLAQPLSYTMLIRQILPRVTKEQAWNAQEWALYQDEKYSRLERAVEQIEALGLESRPPAVELPAANPERSGVVEVVSPSPVGDVSAQGLVLTCRESVAYQQFSVHVLIGMLHRSATQLFEKEEQCSPADRVLLANVRQQLDQVEARWTTMDAGVTACAA